MSSTNLLVLRDKVQRYARQLFDTVNIDEDNDIMIPYGSTMIHVVVSEDEDLDEDGKRFRNDNDLTFTHVGVWAIALWDVEPTAELYKWVATDGQLYNYGGYGVRLKDAPSTKANLVFRYSIAGDTLDPGELKNALIAIALTVDGEDDHLKSLFGGLTVEDVMNNNS